MRTLPLLLLILVSIASAQKASKQSFDALYSESLEKEVKEKVAVELAQKNVPAGFASSLSDSLTGVMLKKIESLVKPIVGRTYDITARTGILPVSFSKLEKDANTYSLGRSLTLGAGVSWLWGTATYTDSKTIRIDPDLFLGVGADLGPRVNEESKLGFALGLNGYVGFNKAALSVGRDFLNGVYVIGIATTIDMSSLSIAQTKVTSFSEIISPEE